MRHSIFARVLFGAALACACAGANAKDAGKRADAGTATPEQVAADPAAVWKRFLAEAELGDAFAHFDAMDAVGYNLAAVDADSCRDQAAQLRAAVEALPVSISMHRVAMMCADAVGDSAGAERESAALAALSKYVLSGSGGTVTGRPIRVVSPRDVYALLVMLGYEFRYEYYKSARPDRYMPMIVAAWDPEAKVERHMSFDFVDATFSIDRDDPYATFPFQRHRLAEAFIDAQTKSDETVGLDIRAVRSALDENDPAQRLKYLREGAARGGLSSLHHWIVFCKDNAMAGCADGLVDALLPLAEREHGAAMALLAMAYAEGIGIKRDLKAAGALLDAADRRWHQRGASVYYATVDGSLRDAGYGEFAMRRLEASAKAGNPDAEFLLLLGRIIANPLGTLRPDDLALLERPSSNGQGMGLNLLASYHDDRQRRTEARDALRRAADAGSPGAQFELAKALKDEARDGGRNDGAWLPLMQAAAQGGEVRAMLELSYREGDAGQWQRAANWLLAGVAQNDVEAILELAALYEEEHPGLRGDLADAIDTYESLSSFQDDTGKEARRRLARLAAEGRGMKRNFGRVKSLLRPDANDGDATSQGQLGMLLLEYGAPTDREEGERWATRAIEAGNDGARIGYTQWLLHRPDGDAEGRRRAIAMMLETDRDSAWIGSIDNNLAWALCVSPHADVRDPAAGLVVARRMERGLDELDPGDVDTVAACYAANGDFATAARLQQKVIDALPRGEDGKPQGDRGVFDRLALYRAGKPFIDNR
jgi:TPR repeat protein